ncbi:MAG: iron export ABC transporter permease subunit FetB, partial [Candidatus Hydrogenedentes bacterium]|nr:iron export ABC transporter permease subunit FetB [Candidatus Hydrogenedentota bacterium]
MTSDVIPLAPFDLAIAACLVLAAGGASFALRLGLEKRLAIASARTVVQLLLIGFVLRWVFGVDNPLAVMLILALMLMAASRTAVKRPERTFDGAAWRTFVTLLLCGLATTFTVTAAIIHIDPWYRPQYLIPLLGMVLGNCLTGVSLCLDQLLNDFATKRAQVEMELALGATRWEAARDILRGSVSKGLIPIINTMMVVGIVSLPGMMTGQILSGTDPLDAVKYQIVV